MVLKNLVSKYKNISYGDVQVTKLQIGVKKRVEDCDVRSKKGDTLHMHYTGYTATFLKLLHCFILKCETLLHTF